MATAAGGRLIAAAAAVALITNRVNNRSRGFAFVTMATDREANEAIRMFDGAQFGGRTAKVNFPEVPKGGERLIRESKVKGRARSNANSPYKIYVGNLGWTVTSDMLRNAFSACSGVVGANVVYERDTGRSRGFGFVAFASNDECQAALERMDGKVPAAQGSSVCPPQHPKQQVYGQYQSAPVGIPVVGPRPSPTYTVVNAIIGMKEDGPGPRYDHTLKAIAGIGEEGTPGYISPRLILFGGATALEENPATPPSAAGIAGIRTANNARAILVLGRDMDAVTSLKTSLDHQSKDTWTDGFHKIVLRPKWI
ncbi:hypothetical protein HPP92_015641 [Vanilla planifolia]|uniref:RRM domain-containing protein n=1 Tax=Vanilla planifolia TaxID=51239 RepID=A0A835US84_VANPL|nr:hypothetical protein HPP92_015641 [Vanilla planifolia]